MKVKKNKKSIKSLNNVNINHELNTMVRLKTNIDIKMQETKYQQQ